MTYFLLWYFKVWVNYASDIVMGNRIQQTVHWTSVSLSDSVPYWHPYELESHLISCFNMVNAKPESHLTDKLGIWQWVSSYADICQVQFLSRLLYHLSGIILNFEIDIKFQWLSWLFVSYSTVYIYFVWLLMNSCDTFYFLRRMLWKLLPTGH